MPHDDRRRDGRRPGTDSGPEVSALIDWVEDPVVAKIVLGWPARVRADRAARLGLTPDPDVDSIINRYIAESKIQLSGTD